MSTSDTNTPGGKGPKDGAPENGGPENGNALAAAEYALGLLEGEELAAAKARMGDDDGFAWRKVWWDNWFAPLTDNMQGAEPDPAVWDRIAAQIGAKHSGRVLISQGHLFSEVLSECARAIEIMSAT